MPAVRLLAFGLFVLSLSACKKDWKCVCTDPNGHENSTTLSQLTERDAQVACGILATNDLTCQLK